MSPEDEEGVAWLLAHSSLSGVYNHELSARMLEEPSEPAEDESDQLDVEVSMRPQIRRDEDSFGFRIIGEIKTQYAVFSVKVAGEFEMHDGYATPPMDEIRNFGNAKGIALVYPYVRSVVADLSSKVIETAVHLPVITPGEIEFRNK